MSYNKKNGKNNIPSININYNKIVNEGFNLNNNKLKAASNDPIEQIVNTINWEKTPDWKPIDVPQKL